MKFLEQYARLWLVLGLTAVGSAVAQSEIAPGTTGNTADLESRKSAIQSDLDKAVNAIGGYCDNKNYLNLLSEMKALDNAAQDAKRKAETAYHACSLATDTGATIGPMVNGLKATDAVGMTAGCQRADSTSKATGAQYSDCSARFEKAQAILEQVSKQLCPNMLAALPKNPGPHGINPTESEIQSCAQAIQQNCIAESSGSILEASKSLGDLALSAKTDAAGQVGFGVSGGSCIANGSSRTGDSMNPWLAGGIGAVVGAGATVGILAATGNLGGKDKGGSSGGSHAAAPAKATTNTAPPAIAGPGDTAEGSQNLTANDTARGINAGTVQNLQPINPSGAENQGPQGRTASALASGGGSGAGSASGAASPGVGGSQGAQGRMAARSSGLSSGGGYSPSGYGGGGDGSGKDLKDGAPIGYAALSKGCQPKVEKSIRDPKTKKMITVMVDNPNYKTCAPATAKSAPRSPAAKARQLKVKNDALLQP